MILLKTGLAQPVSLSPSETGTASSQANESASDETPLLTRRLAQGEEAAFREFHAAYFDRLYHFLLVVTHGQEYEAQEALQDTLVRVARYVRVFKSEEIFWSWLKRVARSTVWDAGRKQRRYLSLLSAFAQRWILHSAEPASSPDNLQNQLEDVLAKLEPDDRALLEKKYYRGDTVKELAAETGLTQKAVESRLLRLRRQLREQLLK